MKFVWRIDMGRGVREGNSSLNLALWSVEILRSRKALSQDESAFYCFVRLVGEADADFFGNLHGVFDAGADGGTVQEVARKIEAGKFGAGGVESS